MAQGVGAGGSFLQPGRARTAGDPAPLNGGLLTEDPIRFPSPKSLYVRKTGSDANGGDTTAASPAVTGSDGVLDGTAKFTAASGAFDASYVDRPINIVGVGRFRIEAVASATQLTLSVPAGAGAAGSGLTWNVGGAVQTFGALLGNGNAAVREGDTIYVGSGTYRETVVAWVAPKNGASNGSAPISIVGDTAGAITGDTGGMVQLTAYTTDDKTAPSAASLLKFTNQSFLSFSGITFVCGTGSTSGGGTAAAFADAGTWLNVPVGAVSQSISFTDCAIIAAIASRPLVRLFSPYGISCNWRFDRCLVFAQASFIDLRLTTGPGNATDYDCGLVVSNSIIWSTSNTTIFSPSSAANATTGSRGGGGLVRNCLLCGPILVVTTVSQTSATIPFVVSNSVLIGSSGLTAGASGQITEDYNIFQSSTPRTNVSAGAHSVSDGSYAPLFHFGQELQWGGLLRSFGEPMAGSPLAGFGNDGSQTAYDLRNQPRPAGGGNALPAVGALERSNSFAKETGTVHSGTTAISATGPAYQDFLVAVAGGTSYTFSIYANYDASYTGTAPQLLLLNGTEAGVAAQTVTAGGSAGGGWTQVSLAPFTPSSDGFVTVRMLSNDTSGISKVVFDTFATA